MLGFEASSQTAQNLLRTGEIVINLVDEKQVDVVNRLSMLTGTTLCPKESRSAATAWIRAILGPPVDSDPLRDGQAASRTGVPGADGG